MADKVRGTGYLMRNLFGSDWVRSESRSLTHHLRVLHSGEVHQLCGKHGHGRKRYHTADAGQAQGAREEPLRIVVTSLAQLIPEHPNGGNLDGDEDITCECYRAWSKHEGRHTCVRYMVVGHRFCFILAPTNDDVARAKRRELCDRATLPDEQRCAP